MLAPSTNASRPEASRDHEPRPAAALTHGLRLAASDRRLELIVAHVLTLG